MGDYTRWLRGLLSYLDRQIDALSSCVSGQRGTIAKPMYEEHLCVVALTSIERGTQFFTLPSTSLCDLPLLFFVYFQVNNGVLYFLDYEDNLHHGPLCSRFNVIVRSYLFCLNAPVAQRYHVTSDTLGREFDRGKRDFSH